MATTQTAGGTAQAQGGIRGARARDYATTIEPASVALYEAVLDELDIRLGTCLLDVGCGSGLFLRIAAQRGALVAGLDAAPSFVEIATQRVPDAEVGVGDMEALPYADDSFDGVTGFNAFHLAADPGKALREAGRVSRPGAPIVIATWGRPELCEAAAFVTGVGALLPSVPHGATGPFALSEPGALEDFAARGALSPRTRRDVQLVWSFADEAMLLRALKSTCFAAEAIDAAGEDAVDEAILRATAPYRTSDGGCRLENVFTYLMATA